MSSFLDNFYEVLFHPDKAFSALRENPPLLQGFIIVILISILNPIINLDAFKGTMGVVWLGLSIFSSAFAGVVSWLFFASFIDILASIFKQSGRIREFLTLSAFALLPWIFLGPVELFKTAGLIGGLFGILLGLIIWLWVISLIILALIKTYDLSISRALVLLVLPFFGGFLAFNWIIGFFTTLTQILRV